MNNIKVQNLLNERDLKDLLSGKVVSCIKEKDGFEVETFVALQDIGYDRMHFVVAEVTGRGTIKACSMMLMKCVNQIKHLHSLSNYMRDLSLKKEQADILFGKYYDENPDMKFLRDLLGNYESIKEELKTYGNNNNSRG